MRYTLDIDVPVPMPDGTKLMTNIWRPEVDESVPVLFARGPYGKDNGEFYAKPNTFAFVQAGYAVAVQDARGAHRSGGSLVPHQDDPSDGAATIEWLAEQSWCTGSVGMFGGSYMGMVQWLAASIGVPALKAIAPMVTSADPYRAPWYSSGGAFSAEVTVSWAVSMAAAECARQIARGAADADDLAALSALLSPEQWLGPAPLAELPLVAKYLPWIDSVFAHPTRDEFWQGSAIDRVSSIRTPALTVTGWYDLFIGESLAAYEALQRDGAEPARGNQRLVIGPWSHGPLGLLGRYPDRHFGLAAMQNSAELTATHIAFFDRWLKGDEHALDDVAPVRIFVMGIDRWRDEQQWPLPDVRYTDYHLDSGGRANTAAGDGVLSPEPAAGTSADRYLYDPRRPVPTLGGHVLGLTDYNGPADQSPVEGRDDVLVYSTAPLDVAVEVTGPVSATLHVSSAAVDTDFTAKLVDVFPDGRAMLLCEGVQRMRYRDSLVEPTPITPGEVYPITIDMTATSNVFLPGHRIRLEVASSNFPRYDRNSNTGGDIAHEPAAAMVTAVNQVHHGAGHRSRLILPIIDRGTE